MISVCVATYNGEKYIKEQLESILKQLGSDDEVIISDDGSTDSTLEAINSLCEPRIHVYQNAGRHGVLHNFENALQQAAGDYIFLSDQDDLWIEGKVARCLREFQHYSVDLVLHNAKIVDVNNNIICNSFFKLRNSRPGFLVNLYKNSYMGCCMAFRREILAYVLPFPQVAMHDLWIGLSVEKRGSVRLIEEPLILYRRHDQNVSSTGEKGKISCLGKLSYRANVLYEILKR